MTDKTVLIIGPGFIGWNVLDLLVGEGYKVTGLVRRKEHGDQIAASGALVVIGDLNDKSLIAEQTAKHAVTFHTATADHLPSVEAVVDGIRRRAAEGLPTIFIHTSGTSVLDDGAVNAYKSDKVYHDQVRSEIDSVPDNAPHREIDLAILKAQQNLADTAKIAIMIPPLIYGCEWRGSFIVTWIDADPHTVNPEHGRLTIQIPTLTRFALKHGYAPCVGKGLGVESNIHVFDLARAYMVLLHHLELTAPAETLENPYYFCKSQAGKSRAIWFLTMHPRRGYRR
jgi:nucleoside-diphosphate-sugar epimerase